MAVIKNIAVYLIALLTFFVASKLINGVGNMPQFMVDAYESSIFVKTGTKTIAMVTLCSLILVFLIYNFYQVKDGVHTNKVLSGMIYGASFGIVWFFGFLEMNTINNDNVPAHIQSGIRDLVVLSIFGLSAGLLLAKNRTTPICRDRRTLWAIPFVSIGFALFHAAQLFIVLREVGAYQKIDSAIDVIWLLCFGAWLGGMYVVFLPGIKIKNKYLRALFFSFVFFGTDWLLFNLFYNIFLDIPLLDLTIRSSFGCLGVFLGLAAYERVFSK